MFQDYEEAIFLEDDAVLEPYYVQQLDRLMDFFKDDPRVGMVNCFGEGHRDKELYDWYLHGRPQRLRYNSPVSRNAHFIRSTPPTPAASFQVSLATSLCAESG